METDLASCVDDESLPLKTSQNNYRLSPTGGVFSLGVGFWLSVLL